MKLKQRIASSAYYGALAFFNFMLSMLPTFYFRKNLLRLFGWQIGRGVSIHRGLRITSLTKPCCVGDFSVINRNVLLDNRKRIVIGANVSISQGCSVYTFGHDIDSNDFCGKGQSVIIGSHAVLFSNVTLMPGVIIGAGAVVLPCSVVTKSLQDKVVVGGNPAVFKRFRNSDLSYELDHRVWFGI
jgi:putative colanic acid biosynthesis acetyltransferase WcaF